MQNDDRSMKDAHQKDRPARESGSRDGIRWRRIGAIGGGLAALLFVVLLVAPSLIDWTPHRARLAALASRVTGLEIRLDGSVSLHLLPQPAFRVERLSIAGGVPIDLRVGAVEMVMDWRALMRGRLVARTIRLIRPTVRIEEPLAFDRWWKARRRIAPPAGETGRDGPPELPGRFEATDGSLLLAEPEGGRLHRFELRRVLLLRLHDGRPWRIEYDGALDGIPVAMRIEGGRRHRDGDMAVRAVFELAGTALRYSGRVRIGERGGPGDRRLSEADGRFEARIRSPAGLIAAGREWSGRPPLRAADLPAFLKAPIDVRGRLLLDERGVRFEELRGRLDKGRFDGRMAVELAPFELRFALECDRFAVDDLIPLGAPDADGSFLRRRTPLRLAERRAAIRARLADLPGPVTGELKVRALRWRDLLARDAVLAVALDPGGRTDLRFEADLPGGGHARLTATAPEQKEADDRLVGTVRIGLPSLTALMPRVEGEREDGGSTDADHASGTPFDRLEAVLGWRWQGADLDIEPLKLSLDGRPFRGRLAYREAETGSTEDGKNAFPRLSLEIAGEELPLSLLLDGRGGAAASAPRSPERLLDAFARIDEALPPWRMRLRLSFERIALGATELESVKAEFGHDPGGRLALSHFDFRREGVAVALRDGGFEMIEDEPGLKLTVVLREEEKGALAGLFDLAPRWKEMLPERVEGTIGLRARRADLSFALEAPARRLTVDGDLHWNDGDADEKKGEGSSAPPSWLPAAVANAVVPPDRLDLGWRLEWRNAAALARLPSDAGMRSLLMRAADHDGQLDLRGRLAGAPASLHLTMRGVAFGIRTELEIAPATGAQGRSPRTLRLTLAHDDLRGLGIAKKAPTALPLDLALDGRLDTHAGTVRVRGAAVGRSRGRGRIDWRQAGEDDGTGEVRFAFDITADRVDLDELGIGSRSSSRHETPLVWSVRPFETLLPSSWRGEGRVSAATIRLRGKEFFDLVAEGTVHDGRVDLTDLRVAGLKGVLRATGRFGLATAREIAVKATVKGLAADELLSFVGAPAVLEGRLDGEISLAGTGESSYDLVSRLEGGGRFEWKKPVFVGVDLDAVARDLATLAQSGREAAGERAGRLIRRALAGGRTAFSDTRFEVTISQGRARFGPLRLVGRESRLDAALSLDLPALRVEGGGKVRLLPLDATAPALGLRLEGPADAPEIRWDSALLERWLVARLVRRVLPRLPLPPPDDPLFAPPDILAPADEGRPDAAPSPMRDLFGRVLERLRERMKDDRPPE